MNVLCMPQAFKGSLAAPAAARAMVRGVLLVAPDAQAQALPMADGGDDTLDVLIGATDGQRFTIVAQDPLLRPVEADWGVLGDGETVIIEMAQASGLRLLAFQDLAPKQTSTYGTGQLLHAGLEAGYRRFIVGVGGSATVDAGTGAATALGVRFLDAAGRELPPGGGALAQLTSIDRSGLDRRWSKAEVHVACDVDMPLCGPRGAGLFAPQKGASPGVVRELEQALLHFCVVLEQATGINLRDMPMAGPSGGLAGMLHAVLGAHLRRGSELILDLAGLGDRIPGADLVIVGEGTMDWGSFEGKGPSVVAARARDAGVPVLAVVGQLADDSPPLDPWGIRDVEPLMAHAPSPEYAQRHAEALVEMATEQVVRRYLRTA